MRTIIEIRVWINKERTELRVYVSFSDKSEGCYYKTGNRYQAKGLLENITEEEKHEAFLICEKFHGPKGWKTVRRWELNPEPKKEVIYKSYSRDEEDLDVASRKEFKPTTNFDFTYEG